MDQNEIEIDLDEDFPLGDGRAESSAMVNCPYCGQDVELLVDPGGGSEQDYVEDCEVCCNPWSISVRYEEGVPLVSVTALDE